MNNEINPVDNGRKTKAFFFDRDGVLNHLIGPKFNRGPRTLEELEINFESIDVIRSLNASGFLIVVITNQPDLSRGKLSEESNEEIIQELKKAFLPVKINYYECPHDNHHFCVCRKPKNGLIEKAIFDLNIDRSLSFFVGDRWTDIEASIKSEIKPFLYENPDSPDMGGLRLSDRITVETLTKLDTLKNYC